MQCLDEISCESQLHSRQSTIRQEVGSLSIGRSVGGARNLGGDGGDNDVGGDGGHGGLGGVDGEVGGKVFRGHTNFKDKSKIMNITISQYKDKIV